MYLKFIYARVMTRVSPCICIFLLHGVGRVGAYRNNLFAAIAIIFQYNFRPIGKLEKWANNVRKKTGLRG